MYLKLKKFIKNQTTLMILSTAKVTDYAQDPEENKIMSDQPLPSRCLKSEQGELLPDK